jgi:hypothetical protein
LRLNVLRFIVFVYRPLKLNCLFDIPARIAYAGEFWDSSLYLTAIKSNTQLLGGNLSVVVLTVS